MTKTQIERHAELVNRAHFSTKLEHKAMWLNMAKDFRKGTLVVVKTRSCDWFSNQVKELKMETEKIECPKCEGVGDLVEQGPDGYGRYYPCPKCKGTGEVNATRPQTN